jgi:hypothetical protein
MNFAESKDLLEALSYVATIIGIPVAIFVFLYEKRKDRLAQEVDSYLRANEKYVQYLSLCLEHPGLECFDLLPLEPQVKATGLDIKKLTLFTILISVLETGYLLYRRHKGTIRQSQWPGWRAYMEMWASRSDFRRAWPTLGPQFDSDFYALMNQLIRETKPLNGSAEA